MNLDMNKYEQIFLDYNVFLNQSQFIPFVLTLKQRPNLKNLSGGLNLSNLYVARFKPALDLNRVLADLSRG